MTEKRYGKWAGNPKGFPQNPENCVAAVPNGYITYQCARKKAPGSDYCWQHGDKKNG